MRVKPDEKTVKMKNKSRMIGSVPQTGNRKPFKLPKPFPNAGQRDFCG
jgi:hypothetical protein